MSKIFESIKVIYLKKCDSHCFLILLAALTGILTGTSYIPFPAWAVFFCYIPLWWAVLKAVKQNKSYKYIFFLGWISQFVLTLIGFNWIYYLSREFGQLPIVISALALLLFATLMHIYIPLSLVLAVYIQKRFQLTLKKLIFLLALCLIILERYWPSIFEWNLGYTFLWMNWPWAQWADTVGFWGLSSFILMIQACVLYLLTERHRLNSKKLTILYSLLGLFLASTWFGGEYKKINFKNKTDQQLWVTIVQANISNQEKLQAEKGPSYQPFVINAYIQLTEKELNRLEQQNSLKPDFIIWPETALPIALDTDYHYRPHQQYLLKNVRKWGTQLITGAYSQDPERYDHLGQNLIRNSVFFINENGENVKPYFKTDLLVFGEYMPFGKELPLLYKIFPFVGVYEKGPGPVQKIIKTQKGQLLSVGPQICYESLNPGFSRGLAEKNNQIFFNLTNDSWFGWWAEPYQHMVMTLGRGLENRRPLVRSTNTGISTVITAAGDILEQSPINKTWASTYQIPYSEKNEITFYAKWGYLDELFWLLLLLLTIAIKDKNNVRD